MLEVDLQVDQCLLQVQVVQVVPQRPDPVDLPMHQYPQYGGGPGSGPQYVGPPGGPRPGPFGPQYSPGPGSNAWAGPQRPGTRPPYRPDQMKGPPQRPV